MGQAGMDVLNRPSIWTADIDARDGREDTAARPVVPRDSAVSRLLNRRVRSERGASPTFSTEFPPEEKRPCRRGRDTASHPGETRSRHRGPRPPRPGCTCSTRFRPSPDSRETASLRPVRREVPSKGPRTHREGRPLSSRPRGTTADFPALGHRHPAQNRPRRACDAPSVRQLYVSSTAWIPPHSTNERRPPDGLRRYGSQRRRLETSNDRSPGFSERGTIPGRSRRALPSFERSDAHSPLRLDFRPAQV